MPKNLVEKAVAVTKEATTVAAKLVSELERENYIYLYGSLYVYKCTLWYSLVYFLMAIMQSDSSTYVHVLYVCMNVSGLHALYITIAGNFITNTVL